MQKGTKRKERKEYNEQVWRISKTDLLEGCHVARSIVWACSPLAVSFLSLPVQVECSETEVRLSYNDKLDAPSSLVEENKRMEAFLQTQSIQEWSTEDSAPFRTRLARHLHTLQTLQLNGAVYLGEDSSYQWEYTWTEGTQHTVELFSDVRSLRMTPVQKGSNIFPSQIFHDRLLEACYLNDASRAFRLLICRVYPLDAIERLAETYPSSSVQRMVWKGLMQLVHSYQTNPQVFEHLYLENAFFPPDSFPTVYALVSALPVNLTPSVSHALESELRKVFRYVRSSGVRLHLQLDDLDRIAHILLLVWNVYHSQIGSHTLHTHCKQILEGFKMLEDDERPLLSSSMMDHVQNSSKREEPFFVQKYLSVSDQTWLQQARQKATRAREKTLDALEHPSVCTKDVRRLCSILKPFQQMVLEHPHHNPNLDLYFLRMTASLFVRTVFLLYDSFFKESTTLLTFVACAWLAGAFVYTNADVSDTTCSNAHANPFLACELIKTAKGECT